MTASTREGPLSRPAAPVAREVRRRVLVVAGSFPPSAAVGAQRTLRLLHQLDPRAWDVTVLTLSPETYRSGTPIDERALDRVPSTVRVVRAPALRPFERLGGRIRGRAPAAEAPAARQSGRADRPRRTAGWLRGLRRAAQAACALPDRDASWILPAVSAARRLYRSDRPEVIFSTGPPYSAHVVASLLARLWNRRWVAEFRDPWARAPWREDRYAFEHRVWAMLERAVVRRADAAVFVTRANQREFVEHYGPGVIPRFHVVPNGCDPSDFAALIRRPPEDRFIVLHAGSLYGGRSPLPLFRAIARGCTAGLIDRARFRLRLIGRVSMPGVDLRREVVSLGIGDVVEFIPHVPRGVALQAMVDASVLLVLQPVTKVSVPAKLYEYLATGRPILALAEADGDTAATVLASPAAVVVPPADEDGILAAIVRLQSESAEGASVDPAVYDGMRRAAEVAGLLRAVADGPGAAVSAGSRTVVAAAGSEGR